MFIASGTLPRSSWPLANEGNVVVESYALDHCRLDLFGHVLRGQSSDDMHILIKTEGTASKLPRTLRGRRFPDWPVGMCFVQDVASSNPDNTQINHGVPAVG
jgi:hypothetical protein